MFKLSAEPIVTEELSASLTDVRSGAKVCFEGIVRNHNDGLDVLALEYEAYEELVCSEAELILQETRSRFDIYKVICVHRTGKLWVGETAVWVGVLSAHRDEAFQACRFVIDEVKARLPIWKREEYVSGLSTWVNCQHAAHQQLTDINLDHIEMDVFALSTSEISQYGIVEVITTEEASSRLSSGSKSSLGMLKSVLRSKIYCFSLAEFDNQLTHLEKHAMYLVVSDTDARSRNLVVQMRQLGFTKAFYVSGGPSAFRRKFIA